MEEKKLLDRLTGEEREEVRKLLFKREELRTSDHPDKDKLIEEIDRKLETLTVLSVKETEKMLTIKKVAILVKELIGDRSIRQTSADSGIAASYISGILKYKYLPSADILRKLTAPEASPKNGVTLEDLMVAAGYQTDYVEEAYKDAFYEEVTDERSGKTIDIMPNMEMMKRALAYSSRIEERIDPQERHRQRMQEISKFESMATGIVYKALAEKGIQFSNANETVGVRGFRPDMSIYVPMQPILEWWFEFKFLGDASGRNGNRGYVNLKHIIGQFMFIEPKLERKISLVISNKDDFEAIMGYKDKLAYRGDLSVILVDTENFSVVREEYLAHYNMYEKDSEFYIV